MKRIPQGWTKYQPIGQSVFGTKIIPFKVPLKQEAYNTGISKEQWFTPVILLQKQPQLKTIIDLTDTHRYYDPQEFERNGVTHIKINITGGGALPSSFKIRQFFEAVDAFMKKYKDDPDALMGVHCTHGINRTGYFICKYMVDRLKISPEDAISRFQSARGYPIERNNYVNAIKNRGRPKLVRRSECTSRNINEYTSPLGHNYGEERNRSNYSRNRYRRGGTSIDRQSYNGRSHREHISGEKHWRNGNAPFRNNTNETPYARNSYNDLRMTNEQDRNHSNVSCNWRERP